jgi:phosphoenolpyruvate carboxylase
VLDIAETNQLLDKEPIIRRSIKVRNPYVDPMNYIQIALLQRLRTETNPEAAQSLRRAVLLSVNGIAAGLQNVG